MFVLKLTDPKYSWGYCLKDSLHCHGQLGFFTVDDVFDTESEAEEYIETLLKDGWFRPDITKANFETVEVKQYKGLGSFYYTKEAYEKFKED